jgi:phospholipid-translocating ATPase
VTNQLNEFSCSGLRTLCLAKKEINAHSYKCWAETWSIAACSLHNRNEQLDELAEEIEKGMNSTHPVR